MFMSINGRSLAFLVSKEGIEQVELTQPWQAVKEAGGTPRLVSVEPGTVQGWQEPAREFVRRFLATGRPVAVICHGGWILIDVDAVRGRRITSWPSMAVDYRNAGAEWVDEELVVCTGGNFPLISSRKPDDLPAFCRELVSQVGKESVAASGR
jgi:protease I